MAFRKVMASAASANLKGQAGGVMMNKTPSLSPSPPPFPRKFGGNYSTGPGNGRLSDSDAAITEGMRDLSLRKKAKTPTKHYENRRSFGTNTNNNRILKSLEDVANILRDGLVKNVVIVAGAGISTPSGIPDFRTPGTGLYDNLQQYNIPYPEAIFDIDYFHHNPRPFFALAKELYPSGKYRPNYLHYFARLLNDHGLLLRVYTQNIDGLERLAGLPSEKLVEAHGTFATATCVSCDEKYNGAELKDAIFSDKLPRCKKKGCVGIIKPDIVFFGEELPKRFYFYLKDMLQTDLVLIMGTSLEVQPFAGIIDTVRYTVPRVLFNRNAVGPFKRGKRAKDFVYEGDLLEKVQSFAEMSGMKQDMINLITKTEGTFRLAAPPPVELSKPAVAKENKTSSALEAIWRQNAQLNIYSDSDSSESSNVNDSDSESSSSSEKKSNHSNKAGKLTNKPKNGPTNSNSPIRKFHSTVSGKPPVGPNRNNSNYRNYSSLLAKRKENSAQLVPISMSQKPKPNGAISFHSQSSETSINRRKSQIDVAISPNKKLSPLPGSHATKPRSNSVNKATPEKARSNKVSGFRAVIDRVRSAKTPTLSYRHRLAKPVYDARVFTYNNSNSSTSEEEDDDDEEDDDTSSDDSR